MRDKVYQYEGNKNEETAMTQDPKDTARWVVDNNRSPYNGAPPCSAGYYTNETWVHEAQWAIDSDDYSEIVEMLALEEDYSDFREWQRDIPAREEASFEGWEAWI